MSARKTKTVQAPRARIAKAKAAPTSEVTADDIARGDAAIEALESAAPAVVRPSVEAMREIVRGYSEAMMGIEGELELLCAALTINGMVDERIALLTMVDPAEVRP